MFQLRNNKIQLDSPVCPDLLLFLKWETKGDMSSISGKATGVEIFLWNLEECSNRFRWKLATMGSFFMVSCFVDSCGDNHSSFTFAYDGVQ